MAYRRRVPIATVDLSPPERQAKAKPVKRSRITETVLARARVRRKRPQAPFTLVQAHPSRALPSGRGIAQDQAISGDLTWASTLAGIPGVAIESAYAEGQAFLGYAYLAQLAQRSEYRRMSEIIAQEMTRKWIRVQSSGTVDKTERIKELTAELERLKVRSMFRKMAEHDAFFGRAHLYLDLGVTEDREELRTPIGDGRDALSKSKVGRRKPLIRLKAVEAVWVYPIDYNSSDPLRTDWYKPTRWFVMGKEIHSTRLLTFVGREVPDLLKPVYSFGGLSLTQMAKPYVDNWLRTRQSIADLIHAFSVFVLKTDLHQALQLDGEELFRRAELFNDCRDNKGLMLVDKATEDFTNVTASLTALDKLQAQVQEHMAAVTGIPIVKLLGIQPAGLNASSEGEIRTFYDSVHAFQELLFTDNLRKVIDFTMLSLWGEVDQAITFSYVPLWSLDAKGEAEIHKISAETDRILIDSGIIAPAESRKRIASDPNTPYASLDESEVLLVPENQPNLKQEEEQGLMPGKEHSNLEGTSRSDEDENEEHEDGFDTEPNGLMSKLMNGHPRPRTTPLHPPHPSRGNRSSARNA